MGILGDVGVVSPLLSLCEWNLAPYLGFERTLNTNFTQYAAQLKSYAVTMESGPFTKVPTLGERAVSGKLASEIWKVALSRFDA